MTAKSLQVSTNELITKGSEVECNGYRSYLNLKDVKVKSNKFEVGGLLWVRKAVGNLKTFLLGTYHGRCTELQAYLDEFCFRFNRCEFGNQIFLRLAVAVATSCMLLS